MENIEHILQGANRSTSHPIINPHYCIKGMVYERSPSSRRYYFESGFNSVLAKMGMEDPGIADWEVKADYLL